MFADISGFTAMSQAMDPEELTRIMNLAFRLLEEAVISHGGHVARYMGDAILALFGIPNALEDAPREAVNAAIDIRHRLVRLNQEHRLRVPLDIHVGINSGLMVAGDVGGAMTHEFTVMGDAVNLASRLKDASGPKCIWVGRQTYQDTRFDFAYRKLKPLRLKGIAQPITAYEVLSTTVQHERGRTRPERRLFSEIVGRDRELQEIGRCLAEVREGRGGVVNVVGEAGIGKSRLIAEAIARDGTGATVLEARALAVGEGLSYHPFVDLLRHWAAIAADDVEPRALEKVGAAVRELLGSEADDVIPFVATLMGLHLPGAPGERVRGIEGEALEKLIQKSVRDLLQALTRRNPLVLLFEDMHWADLSSVALLQALLPLVETCPVLLLMAFRPGHTVSSRRILDEVRHRVPGRHLEIDLGPLDERQCALLLGNLLKIDDRPHTTRSVVLSKAEGNPFFIEEVVRSLIEEGAIEETDAGLRVTEKIESVDVPATVHEVVMARVDRLPEDVRRILQLASVIGRSVPLRVLAAVAEEPRRLAWGLGYLKRAQLLDERHAGDEHEYLFKHALAREAVYESLLLRTRGELHRAIAESIESLFAERLPEYYGMLAYHFSRAERLEKAEEYLFKAGEEAVRAAGSSEALHYFREASRLYLQMHRDGGDPRKKAVLEQNIGLALLNTGDLTEAIEHFDAALALLGEHVPRSRIGGYVRFALDLLGVLGQLYVRTGRRREVTDWPRERQISHIYFNRGRAEITSDPTRLLIDLVGAFRRFNRIDMRQIDQASAMYASFATMFCYSGLSFAVSRRALAIAKGLIRPGNARDVFTCASMEFIHHYLLGDWKDECVIDEGLVEEALRCGQLWDVNTYLGLYCDRRLRQGDFAGARALLARLDDMNDSYGYAFAGTNHDGMTALLLVEERRLAEACRAAEDYTAMRHEDALRVLGLGTCAKAQLLLGRREAAERSLAAAERITSRSIEVPPWHLSAYAAARLRHQVALLEETLAGGGSTALLGWHARGTIRHALRVAAKVSIQRTEIHQLAGRIWWLLGRRAKALRAWERALTVGEQMGARPELARTWAVAGESLADGGVRLRGLDGVACLARSLEMFRALGLEREAEHARQRASGAVPAAENLRASGAPW